MNNNSAFTIPTLSTIEMREVDRLAVEEYHIQLPQMMENAGRNLALLTKHLLDDEIEDSTVVVLAGRGNNGGGGLVAARHLSNWGAWVQVVLTHSAQDYQDVPAHQLQILQAMEVPLAWAEDGWELPPADLVIDALIGYGLQNEPQGQAKSLIELANSSLGQILSLDTPSGIDTTTGQAFTPHIHAAATMTLALPKQGLLQPEAYPACGELYLADISIPPLLYEQLGLDIPHLFARDTILPLDVVDGVVTIRQ